MIPAACSAYLPLLSLCQNRYDRATRGDTTDGKEKVSLNVNERRRRPCYSDISSWHRFRVARFDLTLKTLLELRGKHGLQLWWLNTSPRWEMSDVLGWDDLNAVENVSPRAPIGDPLRHIKVPGFSNMAAQIPTSSSYLFVSRNWQPRDTFVRSG